LASAKVRVSGGGGEEGVDRRLAAAFGQARDIFAHFEFGVGESKLGEARIGPELAFEYQAEPEPGGDRFGHAFAGCDLDGGAERQAGRGQCGFEALARDRTALAQNHRPGRSLGQTQALALGTSRCERDQAVALERFDG
jgi:hypothetical protein